MINNYQRDAGEEDDRDSGSLTLLASLAEGDQVCHEGDDDDDQEKDVHDNYNFGDNHTLRSGWNGEATATRSCTATPTSSYPSLATWSPGLRNTTICSQWTPKIEE